MLRGIWGDPQRYEDTYWARWPQYYFAGDGAKLDEDGAIWLLGRVDDVMNVSGPPHLDDRGRVRPGVPRTGG
jgi:acetyl-CoA synthetase